MMAAGTALVLAACSDGSGPASRPMGTIALSVATRAPTGSPSPAFASDTQSTATDTIILDTVQVVLRKISLGRDGMEEDCEAGGDNQGGDTPVALMHDDSAHHEGDDDACERLEAGPLIIDLPLTPGAQQSFTVTVDTGTFDRVHYQIHKLTADSGDQALLALHPEFTDISIRVVGSFNGTAFTYTNGLTANQMQKFTTPISVTTAGPVDLTLLVDVSTWFKSGDMLLDPTVAANDGTITHNIRASFHTFKDEDHDCHDDDGGDHHGGEDVAINLGAH
jgi:hypothetical protein